MMTFLAGNVLIVGMTRRNVERLTAGQPFRFEVPPPLRGMFATMILAFGETKPDIVAEMERAGFQISQEIKDVAASDPL